MIALMKKPMAQFELIEMDIPEGGVLGSFKELYKLINCDTVELLNLPNEKEDDEVFLTIFMDEEGKLKSDVKPNILIEVEEWEFKDALCGTIVIIKNKIDDEGESIVYSITEDDFNHFMKFVKGEYISI